MPSGVLLNASGTEMSMVSAPAAVLYFCTSSAGPGGFSPAGRTTGRPIAVTSGCACTMPFSSAKTT